MMLPVGILTLFMFCTWAVYLGGLASLQADCSKTNAPSHLVGITGFTGTDALTGIDQSCMKVYRFQWFVLCWEFVIIVGLVTCLFLGKIPMMRAAWVGLLSISTILYMYVANGFLTAKDATGFTSGQPLNRMRTNAAGTIMTAVLNVVTMVYVGMEVASEPPAQAKGEEA